MKNRIKIKNTLILILAVTLMISISAMVAGCSTNTDLTKENEETKIVSYITIDVNPSIQLTVIDGIVMEVNAFNDDGEDLAISYDLINLESEEALEILINAFATQGYLDEINNPSIVITVNGNDEDLADDLEDKAKESLEKLQLETTVIVKDVLQEEVVQAADSGLSTGRYLIIKRLSEKEGISFNDAKDKYAELTMGELLDIVGDLDEVFSDIDFDDEHDEDDLDDVDEDDDDDLDDDEHDNDDLDDDNDDLDDDDEHDNDDLDDDDDDLDDDDDDDDDLDDDDDEHDDDDDDDEHDDEHDDGDDDDDAV